MFRPPSPLWTKALERYREELGEQEIDEYRTMLEAGTFEDLVNHIKNLEPPNAQEKAVINRLGPILKFVNDFSAFTALYFGADVKLAALVWGSIQLILRLASSTENTLQDIVDVLEELSLTLPRFRYYEKTLPIDDNFENALVDVYTEVICFYARTIHFYRAIHITCYAAIDGPSFGEILAKPFIGSSVCLRPSRARQRLRG